MSTIALIKHNKKHICIFRLTWRDRLWNSSDTGKQFKKDALLEGNEVARQTEGKSCVNKLRLHYTVIWFVVRTVFSLDSWSTQRNIFYNAARQIADISLRHFQYIFVKLADWQQVRPVINHVLMPYSRKSIKWANDNLVYWLKYVV